MKKLLAVLLSVCILSTLLVMPVFGSTRFDGLTVLYTISTQAEADALPSVIDATGYQIAVLVTGSDVTLSGLEVFGSTQFGVAVDMQSNIQLLDSKVYEIGDHDGDSFTPTGAQYGVAVYYYGSSGVIQGNTVFDYQKGGIVSNLPEVNGEATLILDNQVTGLGKVDFIAQNGIQVGWGARALVRGNRVSGNYYVDVETPGKGKAIGQQEWVSCGILLIYIQPSQVKSSHNIMRDNQVNLYVYPL